MKPHTPQLPATLTSCPKLSRGEAAALRYGQSADSLRLLCRVSFCVLSFIEV